MAIIVEEEKGGATGTAAVTLGWVVILGVIIAAAYYIFLATPPTIVVPPPANFQSIQPIAQLNFDPNMVLNNPNFQALKQYVAEPTSTGPSGVGRSNPFISP